MFVDCHIVTDPNIAFTPQIHASSLHSSKVLQYKEISSVFSQNYSLTFSHIYVWMLFVYVIELMVRWREQSTKEGSQVDVKVYNNLTQNWILLPLIFLFILNIHNSNSEKARNVCLKAKKLFYVFNKHS